MLSMGSTTELQPEPVSWNLMQYLETQKGGRVWGSFFPIALSFSPIFSEYLLSHALFLIWIFTLYFFKQDLLLR
jgi:hypothetical protein